MKLTVTPGQRQEALAHAIETRRLYAKAQSIGIHNEPSAQNMVQQTKLLMILCDVTDADVDAELERK